MCIAKEGVAEAIACSTLSLQYSEFILDTLDVTLPAWTSDHATNRDGVLVKTPQLVGIRLQGNILVAAYACNTYSENPCGLRVILGCGVNVIAGTLLCCAQVAVQQHARMRA